MLAVLGINALGKILNLLKSAVLIMPDSADTISGSFFPLAKKKTLMVLY
jgi:hypothetical protein